jgi:UDPglucose--hexose-1-phosphate uridylyltransferase
MIRTDSRLSDGRDLFYYSTRAAHDAPTDTRGLEPRAGTGELRYDALDGDWVSVADHRQGRAFLPSTAECPLCPTSADNLTEIPAASFEVVVLENRYPSFEDPGDAVVPGAVIGALGPNAGRCEVICFSDDHDASFADLDPVRVRLVVDAWADRTAALLEIPYVQHVFPFENCGEEIGVTIRHPHGQIYGYPFVPPRALDRLLSAQRHRAATGRSLLRDLLDAELADGSRLVAQTEHWVAFVPFAARWPFQVQAHPRRDVLDLPGLDDAERDDLAVLQGDLLRRLDRLFDVRMPYIAAWFQAPKGELREHARLHLEIYSNRRAPGKLKYLAGSESAMGAWINDVRPEDAARLLREASA